MCVEGLDPGAVGCMAVHGTGTPLGDPIEVSALGQALSSTQQAAKSGPLGGLHGDSASLMLLSAKSCYGHTEGAAGLTGAVLAIEALQQRVCDAFLLSARQTSFSEGPLTCVKTMPLEEVSVRKAV